MRRVRAIVFVVALGAALVVVAQAPALADESGCNGPDVKAQTSIYKLTARTCMEKNSISKDLRGHSKLECWDKRPSPDQLVKCRNIQGSIYFFSVPQSSPVASNSVNDTKSLDLWTIWMCTSAMQQNQPHTYQARALDFEATFPDGTPTGVHQHESFPTTLTCA
jgi:hypothetical protein